METHKIRTAEHRFQIRHKGNREKGDLIGGHVRIICQHLHPQTVYGYLGYSSANAL